MKSNSVHRISARLHTLISLSFSSIITYQHLFIYTRGICVILIETIDKFAILKAPKHTIHPLLVIRVPLMNITQYTLQVQKSS